KEFGPTILWPIRISIDFDEVEWVIERCYGPQGEWREIHRIAGQLDTDFTEVIGADPEAPLTGQQMCEFIAAEFKRQTGEEIDPKAIWEASPTGELAHVFELYAIAKCQSDLSVLRRLAS
ncbi:MAG TPA: hypothetical protein VHU61_14925, partial [Solirubrobacteraceae bacterium]|nr:hypothetical protein [Solirubrobacteraceae bacterium]